MTRNYSTTPYPLDDANDRTFPLNSATLPSMDLADVQALELQYHAPSSTSPTEFNDSPVLPLAFQEPCGGKIEGTQVGSYMECHAMCGQILPPSSSRHRHAFFKSAASDCAPWLSIHPFTEYPEDARLSPALPVFSTDHPPSPDCNKKSRRSGRLPLLPGLDRLRCTGLLSFILSPSSQIWNSQGLWLVLYFSFNLLLTLSNKSVLTSFPFPYTLTSLHTLCSTIGCYILRSRGVYVSKPLTVENELVLAAFSILYAVNIAVSNVSLHLVTVPFHQVIRAATPIFTIVLSSLLLNSRTRWTKLLTLTPVISGVIIATYGDYYFTTWGFFLTLFGTFLAALKTIYTNVLQSPTKPAAFFSFPKSSARTWRHSSFWRKLLVPPSLGLHPLDLLMHMSPLAFIQCIIYAQLSGELDRVRQLNYDPLTPSVAQMTLTVWNGNNTLFSNCTQACLNQTQSISKPTGQTTTLLLNGCIAFGLNVVSLTANGKIGALSMTVAANVKQVLTILFAVFLFDLTITPANALGITITLVGGAWYAGGEYVERQNRLRLSGGKKGYGKSMR